MESDWEAIPGGVFNGGSEARLGGDRTAIEDSRGFGLCQQGQFRALLSPEEDLQGRRPHRRRHCRTHRRRPCSLPVHAI